MFRRHQVRGSTCARGWEEDALRGYCRMKDPVSVYARRLNAWMTSLPSFAGREHQHPVNLNVSLKSDRG